MHFRQTGATRNTRLLDLGQQLGSRLLSRQKVGDDAAAAVHEHLVGAPGELEVAQQHDLRRHLERDALRGETVTKELVALKRVL